MRDLGEVFSNRALSYDKRVTLIQCDRNLGHGEGGSRRIDEKFVISFSWKFWQIVKCIVCIIEWN